MSQQYKPGDMIIVTEDKYRVTVRGTIGEVISHNGDFITVRVIKSGRSDGKGLGQSYTLETRTVGPYDDGVSVPVKRGKRDKGGYEKDKFVSKEEIWEAVVAVASVKG